MLDVLYFHSLICTVLENTPFPHLDRAIPLLLGTAAQESGLEHFRQLPSGPARGLFQMEPATEASHHAWLRRHPPLRQAIFERTGVTGPSSLALEHNIPYQILMARLHYYVRDPHTLPERGALGEQAWRYKQYYNTPSGKGSAAQYMVTFQRLITPWITFS